jgi:hypothetical protein
MGKPRESSSAEVQRELKLTSPELKGPDVKALQERLNHCCEHYKFPWRRIQEDGEYGRRTRRSAEFVAWLIGLSDSRTKAIGSDAGRITEAVQRLLRDPSKRTAQDREREKGRKAKREKLRKARDRGAKAAVAWALKQVGMTESPPNSNRGPKVDAWEGLFGLVGEPWCGCFAGYAVKERGKAQSNCGFQFAGNIHQDAINGNNNLHDVNPADAEPGDIVTFFGDEHIGLVREKSRNGMVLTVDGNTSSDSGRESDGGIVEKKERSFGDVTCVARIEVWG